MGESVDFKSLGELLDYWAEHRGEEKAFTFLANDGSESSTITYAALSHSVRRAANKIVSCGLQPGDRVLLAYPAGIEFIVGLFSSMYAGVLGAPIMFPKSNRFRFGLTEASEKIGSSYVLTASRSVDRLESVLQTAGRSGKAAICGEPDLSILAVDNFIGDSESASLSLERSLSTKAFIQFTSGSTSGPKALLVDHHSCLYNLKMAQAAADTDSNTVFVSWLPHYHDLGLVAHILHAVFCGAHCVLIAPETFIVHPDVWLKSISRYRGNFTGAPDFAYRHCTQRICDSHLSEIDLSSLSVAINAAEPIRSETLMDFSNRFSACGFRDSMFLPSYGMAEATVMISSSGLGERPKVLTLEMGSLANDVAVSTLGEGVRVVSCGKTRLEQRVSIYDPQSKESLPDWHIGEVWVSGENVLQHYINDEDQTNCTFIIHSDGKRYLRTGDLGFFDSNGELYITGRLKDVVIVRGANYYPQEIERVIEACHSEIRLGGVAAFNSIDSEHNLVVVAELDRLASRRVVSSSALSGDLISKCKSAVLEQIGLSIDRMVFVKPGTIPRTTSGKISRQKCKKELQDGLMAVLFSHAEKDLETSNIGLKKMEQNFANDLLSKVFERGPEYLNILTTVSRVVKKILDVDVASIDPQRSLFFYGADSIKMIELQVLLEKELNTTISNHDVFDAKTFEEFLENLVVAVERKGEEVSAIYLEKDVNRYLDDLKPLISKRHEAPSAKNDCVLITGAAGFLGVYILAEMLQTSQSLAICLVRASDEIEGRKKLISRMEKYGVQAEEAWLDRIEIVPGDVMDPLLGMGKERYEDLACRVGRVIHCAAIDNFYLPYSAIRRTNVDGTVNVLKFSLSGAKKQFLHVSSCAASLFDESAKDVDAFGLRNGYAQSKYVSERIVLELAKSGCPAICFRLGYLYHLGLTSLDDDEAFETLIVAMKEMAIVPDMRAVFDLVPIDHAAKCILASEFMPSKKSLYTYYNKVPLNWQDVVGYFRENHEEIKIVPLKKFVQAFHLHVENSNRSGLKLLKSVVNEELTEQMNAMFMDILIDAPPSGVLDCPPCSKEFVYEYLDDVIVGRGKIKKEESLQV